MNKIIISILLLSLNLSISGMCKSTNATRFEQFKEIATKANSAYTPKKRSAQTPFEQYEEILTKLGISYAKSHALVFFNVGVHEAGHALLAQLCGWNQVEFKINTNLNPLWYTGFVSYEFPNKEAADAASKGIKAALISVAGPLFGLGAAWLILKGSNIFTEYRKTNSAIQAFKNGLKKPLLNPDQSKTLQLMTAYQVYKNVSNLLPTSANNDGHNILSAFNFKTPYPTASTIGAISLFPILLMSIYNARTGSNAIIDLATNIHKNFSD